MNNIYKELDKITEDEACTMELREEIEQFKWSLVRGHSSDRKDD